MISFTVAGNPVPKERPRVVHGRTYTPKRTSDAEAWVAAHARKHMKRQPPLAGPVKVEFRFYRESAQPCDIDNLAKLCSDALNGIAFQDDRQIVHLEALKAIDRERPRTEITVAAVAESNPNLSRIASAMDRVAGKGRR